MDTKLDQIESRINELIELISDQLNADIVLFNGQIVRFSDNEIISIFNQKKQKNNIFLILVTPGGSADAAYRIARCLQTKYEKFYLYVTGYCKSAGTLIALGANELIISDHGELGPLDVQITKKDELFEFQSGLTINSAFSSLREKAFTAFERYFLTLEQKSGGQITLKTAMEISTKLTIGLLSPICAQIDPMHLGEAARDMKIAEGYGRRLHPKSLNFDEQTLEYLTTAYPSHGFVIDRQEASELFENVREPSENEKELAELLDILYDNICKIPRQNPEDTCFKVLSDTSEKKENKSDVDQIMQKNNSRDSNRNSSEKTRRNSDSNLQHNKKTGNSKKDHKKEQRTT